MGAVLGLSLTSDDVVWVLVDAVNRTILDHDAFEFPDDAETTGTAARGAHAIATAAGLEVDRVRVTWSDNARHEGLRLLTSLRYMQFDQVDAVPLASVMAVSVEAGLEDMAPRLALAYGAALAEVGLGDAMTEPVSRQIPGTRRSRRSLVYAGLGLSAAAGLGVLFLATASVPQVEPAAATAEQSALPDPGWVSVPAPAGATTGLNRKVVAVPLEAEPAAARPMETYPPVPAAAVPEPATAVPEPAAAVPEPATALPEAVVALPAPEPVAAPPAPEPVAAGPAEQPIGQPHLPDAQHLPAAGPAVGPVADTLAPVPPLPVTGMTEPLDVFAALP